MEMEAQQVSAMLYLAVSSYSSIHYMIDMRRCSYKGFGDCDGHAYLLHSKRFDLHDCGSFSAPIALIFREFSNVLVHSSRVHG